LARVPRKLTSTLLSTAWGWLGWKALPKKQKKQRLHCAQTPSRRHRRRGVSRALSKSSTLRYIFRRGCVKKGAADKQILGGGALGLELQGNAGVVLCCRHPGRTADRTVQSHRGGPSPSVDRAAPDLTAGRGVSTPSTRRGPDGRRRSPSGLIRVVQSPRSCPLVCPSKPFSPWSNPGVASVVQCPRRSPRPWSPPRARAPGHPITADGHHPGRSVSFKAHRAARPFSPVAMAQHLNAPL